MFSHEERVKAIQLFLKYDCSYTATIRDLGYPSVGALRVWYKDYLKSGKISHNQKVRKPKYTEEQKCHAVNHYFEYGQCYARTIKILGYPCRDLLKRWCEEQVPKARKLRKSAVNLTQDQKQEIVKKFYQPQTNRKKLAESSYFYQRQALEQPDKYFEERQIIVTIFNSNFCAYGYRRIHQALKNMGKFISEKIVRKLMFDEKLVVRFSKRKKFSSYAGEITPAQPNLLNRNFKATKPNEEWLTDITEFKIPAGKIYLSPLVDCYDGAIISWTIGTKPDAELVKTMLDAGVATLQSQQNPIVHSDRGAHYRWSG